MMKFFIVAILFAFAEAGVIEDLPNCVIIRNVHYEQEILKDNVRSSYQLAIDHDTNTLFFSYTARTDEMFKSVYLSLKTGEYGIVTGIRGGFANAVNHKTGVVYMGGDDGVYRFNYDPKNATNLDIIDANVWQMFYKDGLYFTTYPEEKAYVFQNHRVMEVPELKDLKVLLVAVNNDQHLVYANSSGVFMHIDKDQIILLSDTIANGITSDIEGKLYFSSPNGLYYVNDETQKAEKLATIDNIYGLAIESNGDFIIAGEVNLIRLKLSRRTCLDEKPINVVAD